MNAHAIAALASFGPDMGKAVEGKVCVTGLGLLLSPMAAVPGSYGGGVNAPIISTNLRYRYGPRWATTPLPGTNDYPGKPPVGRHARRTMASTARLVT